MNALELNFGNNTNENEHRVTLLTNMHIIHPRERTYLSHSSNYKAICLFLFFFFNSSKPSPCIMNLSELDFRGHCDHHFTFTNLWLLILLVWFIIREKFVYFRMLTNVLVFELYEYKYAFRLRAECCIKYWFYQVMLQTDNIQN